MESMQSTEQYIRDLRGPILVLGASGFIGANLFHQILSVRSDVYAVVRRQKSWRLADVMDEKIIECDLSKFIFQRADIQTSLAKSLFSRTYRFPRRMNYSSMCEALSKENYERNMRRLLIEIMPPPEPEEENQEDEYNYGYDLEELGFEGGVD
jgi:nucleoside-diphosphate-sugar epimerase